MVATRDPEWWLSRVGVGLVVLAVLLLYVYAVDHGWIIGPEEDSRLQGHIETRELVF